MNTPCSDQQRESTPTVRVRKERRKKEKKKKEVGRSEIHYKKFGKFLSTDETMISLNA